MFWDGSKFIAFGTQYYMGKPTNSIILSSIDGIKYKVFNANQNGDNGINDLIFSDSNYISVGCNGRINTSKNLTAWQGQNIFQGDVWFNSPEIISDGKNFYIPSETNSAVLIYRSSDGAVWSETSTVNYKASGSGEGCDRIKFDGKKFISVSNGSLYTSNDAIKWTRVSISTSDGLASTASNGTLTVVVGSNCIYYSNNNKDWRKVKSGNLYDKVLYGNGIFVATGKTGVSGTSVISISKDGAKWEDVTTGSFNLNSIVCNNSGFVAVGIDGLIMFSKDGRKWDHIDGITTCSLYSVRNFKNKYVAVGDSGTILNSENGKDWVSAKSPIKVRLFDIAANDKCSVIFGEGNILLTQGQNKENPFVIVKSKQN